MLCMGGRRKGGHFERRDVIAKKELERNKDSFIYDMVMDDM